MKCPKCGAEIAASDVMSDGSIRCHSCGSVFRRKANPVQKTNSDKSLPATVQSYQAPAFNRHCPHCGTPISTGTVCPLCGYDYSKPNGGRPTIPGNGIASIFKVFAGFIYVFSFILGLILGNAGINSYYISHSFSFGIAFVVWLAGFVSGTIPLGLGEIIKLLHEINVKQDWK